MKNRRENAILKIKDPTGGHAESLSERGANSVEMGWEKYLIQGIWESDIFMERCHQETWKGKSLTGDYYAGSFDGNQVIQHVQPNKDQQELEKAS